MSITISIKQHSWLKLKKYIPLIQHCKPPPCTPESLPCIENLSLSPSNQFPLLQLPAELRNIIYHFALVMGTIDLWPQEVADVKDPHPVVTWQEKPSSETSLEPYPGWTRAVRQQGDLEYLRKNKAVCLLRCSRQVYNESHKIFWQKNTFQFSGRGSLVGVEQFLRTIGAENLELIERLNIRYPAHTIWTGRGDRKVWLDQFSKHSPELRLVDVGHEHSHYLEHLVRVRQILADSEQPKEIRLILPNGFATFDIDLEDSYIAEELLKLSKLARLVFVVQRGAFCRLKKPIEQAEEYNMDYIFEAGCFLVKDQQEYEKIEVRTIEEHSSPRYYDVPKSTLRITN